MTSQQETDQVPVRRQDLEKLEKILDTLILECENHNISDADSTLNRWREDVKELKSQIDDPPKTKIAVYGNTGEGKSSLLNALFDQADLLPTSGMGTACTSVIIKIETVKEDTLETGEERFAAEIFFLNKEEWQKEVDLVKNDLRENGGADDDRVQKLARDKFTALLGNFDLESLDTIIEERTDIQEKLGKNMNVDKCSTAKELSDQIEDYIVAKQSGTQYWPIVKSVVIRLYNSLVCPHRVEFVDLPGVADSNPNRVEMAERERQSARILLVVSKIDRCLANPTVESIVGDEMIREVKMDQQKIILVCTKTDDIDEKGAIKLMDSREKEEKDRRLNKIAEYKKELKQQQEQAQRKKKGNPENTQSGGSTSEEASQVEMVSLRSPAEKLPFDSTIHSFNADEQEEMMREIQCLKQQHHSHCASVRTRKVKENFSAVSAETMVFCVSSKDYLKPVSDGLFEMDIPVRFKFLYQKPLDDLFQPDSVTIHHVAHTSLHYEDSVFRHKKDTEIPLLREYLEKEVIEGNKREVLNIQRRYQSAVSATYSYMVNFTMTGKKVDMKQNVTDELQQMYRELEDSSEQFGEKIWNLFREKLFDVIEQGIDGCIQNAENMSSSWGRKTSSVKDGLAFNTYRATVSRKGRFKRQNGQIINFNTDLLQPLSKAYSEPWDKVFREEMWKDLINTQCVGPARDVINKHGDKIQQLLQNELDKQRIENICNIKDEAVSKLRVLESLYTDILQKQQDARRALAAYVQHKMTPTYDQCVKETGPCSYERMKKIMELNVAELKKNLFEEIGGEMKGSILEIKNDACKYVRKELVHIYEDYNQQLMPLWIQQCETKFLQILAEAQKDISPLLNNIPGRTNGRKTPKGASVKRKIADFIVPAPKKSRVSSKHQTGEYEVRGRIEFPSAQDEDTVPKYFTQDKTRIEKDFEDQDLVYLGFNKAAEFLVPRDFTIHTFESLPGNREQNNIYLSIGPKVVVHVTAQKAQVGNQNSLYYQNESAGEREDFTSTQTTQQFWTVDSDVDVAEITFGGTQDEVKKTDKILTQIQHLLNMRYLSIDTQQVDGKVVFTVRRKPEHERSLYMTVKVILQSSLLSQLIASDTVTVTARLSLSNIMDNME